MTFAALRRLLQAGEKPLPPSRGRHRFLVAAPLFALILFTSTFAGLATVSDTQLHSTASNMLTFADGSQGILAENGRIDISSSFPRLEEGDLIVATKGLTTVLAGPWIVKAWDGAFSVVLHGGQLSVAALTTPVLLSRDGKQLLVPAGMQWRSTAAMIHALDGDIAAWIKERVPLSLPSSYLDEQRQRLRTLSPAVPSFQGDMHPAIVDLAAAVSVGDRKQVDTLLQREDVRLALLSSADKQALQILVAQCREDRMLRQLLPFFVIDHDAWLLASIHPRLRDDAWVTAPAASIERSKEAVLLQLLAFPTADALAEPAQELAVSAWQRDLEQFLAAREDAKIIFSLFLLRMEDLMTLWQGKGYVAREASYVEHMRTIAALHPQWLSDAARIVLKRFDAHASFDVKETSQAASSSEAAVPSELPLEEQEAIKLSALKLLTEAGGMLTPETLVQVRAADAVFVRDIVFATSQGDMPFLFTFNPQRQEIRDIIRDGQILPYGLPLDKFVEWVRGE